MTMHGCSQSKRAPFGGKGEPRLHGVRYGGGTPCTGEGCLGHYEVCACGFQTGTVMGVLVERACKAHGGSR